MSLIIEICASGYAKFGAQMWQQYFSTLLRLFRVHRHIFCKAIIHNRPSVEVRPREAAHKSDRQGLVFTSVIFCIREQERQYLIQGTIYNSS